MENRIHAFDITENIYKPLKTEGHFLLTADAHSATISNRVFSIVGNTEDTVTNTANTNTTLTTTNTKLDTLETTLTNIETNTPKTLKQYRAEGKCFSTWYGKYNSVNAGTHLYVNNAVGSGKIIYIYNYEITQEGGYYNNHRLFISDALSSYGTASNITGLLSTGWRNHTDNTLCGYYYNTAMAGTSNVGQISVSCKQYSGTSAINDFQEEWIELRPGSCFYISDININNNPDSTITIRFIIDDE